MQKPHEMVLKEVRSRWSCYRNKSFFQRIIEFGQIKIAAIDIVETATFDEKYKFFTGETLNKWRYDDTGLHFIPKNAELDSHRVEYCKYCIDKEKRRLAIGWANILPSASSGKKIYYFGSGVVYEIAEDNGIEEFKVIRVWME